MSGRVVSLVRAPIDFIMQVAFSVARTRLMGSQQIGYSDSENTSHALYRRLSISYYEALDATLKSTSMILKILTTRPTGSKISRKSFNL